MHPEIKKVNETLTKLREGRAELQKKIELVKDTYHGVCESILLSSGLLAATSLKYYEYETFNDAHCFRGEAPEEELRGFLESVHRPCANVGTSYTGGVINVGPRGYETETIFIQVPADRLGEFNAKWGTKLSPEPAVCTKCGCVPR